MGMKRTVAVALVAVALLAATSIAAVNDGPHDMRERLGISQICQPCHTPHNALGAEDGPIWNHSLTEQTFTRDGEEVTLSGSSKLCLSCHDGVTAVGNFGGITTSGDLITGDAKLGTNLTDDHPIGVEYPASSHTLRSVADVASYLEDGKVECGSCHRAHSVGSYGNFLRKSMVASELCAQCHTFADLPE